MSLPIKASGEPQSPSTTANGSLKKQVAFLPPASGLKVTKYPLLTSAFVALPCILSCRLLQELYGTSDEVGVSDLSSPFGSNAIRASDETNIDNSSGGLFGRFSGLLRSRSAVPSAK